MGDSTGGNKDKRHHEKVKKCHQEVENLICTIIGDCGYKQNRSWDKKMELVKQAKEKVLPWLRQIEALQEAKEDSQCYGEELKQILAALEQIHQSIREFHVSNMEANMIGKVTRCFSDILGDYILNKECTNQAFTIEEGRGELRFNFTPNPDFSQINQQGKNAEVDNQKMIGQEKQGQEVILAIGLLAGRLAELKLAMKKTNQEMGLGADFTNGFFAELCDFPEYRVCSPDLDNFNKKLMEGVTGSSNAAANEANVMLLADETRIFKSYEVFSCNVNVLTEIFEKEPNIDEKFQVADPYFQSVFMNSLAKVYQKIKGKHEMLELEDITSMEVMVNDMQRNGLELSWLKDMLANVRQSWEKRLREEINSCEEMINSCKEKAKEANQKLAKLKKPRLR